MFLLIIHFYHFLSYLVPPSPHVSYFPSRYKIFSTARKEDLERSSYLGSGLCLGLGWIRDFLCHNLENQPTDRAQAIVSKEISGLSFCRATCGLLYREAGISPQDTARR